MRALALPALLVGLAAATVVASPAHAIQLPFTGVLRFQVRALSFTIEGRGFADVDSLSHPTRISIPERVFSAQSLAVPVPASIQASAAPLVSLFVDLANGAGTFVEAAGGFGGRLPLLGVARLCLFAACSAAIANVVVPLSNVGAGGDVTAMGPVNVTVGGAPWTTNDTVTGYRTRSDPFTVMGSRQGPAGGASSTALPSGRLQLVTPVFVSTNLAAEPTVATFAALTLHFVPEPGSLLLLGAGVVALALSTRRPASGARSEAKPSEAQRA